MAPPWPQAHRPRHAQHHGHHAGDHSYDDGYNIYLDVPAAPPPLPPSVRPPRVTCPTACRCCASPVGPSCVANITVCFACDAQEPAAPPAPEDTTVRKEIFENTEGLNDFRRVQAGHGAGRTSGCVGCAMPQAGKCWLVKPRCALAWRRALCRRGAKRAVCADEEAKTWLPEVGGLRSCQCSAALRQPAAPARPAALQWCATSCQQCSTAGAARLGQGPPPHQRSSVRPTSCCSGTRSGPCRTPLPATSSTRWRHARRASACRTCSARPRSAWRTCTPRPSRIGQFGHVCVCWRTWALRECARSVCARGRAIVHFGLRAPLHDALCSLCARDLHV